MTDYMGWYSTEGALGSQQRRLRGLRSQFATLNKSPEIMSHYIIKKMPLRLSRDAIHLFRLVFLEPHSLNGVKVLALQEPTKANDIKRHGQNLDTLAEGYTISFGIWNPHPI